jgi:hypothetical protein
VPGYIVVLQLSKFSFPTDPFLLEMTVHDLEFRLTEATERISCLEGQVQQLMQQHHQLMQQQQPLLQQQQPYSWGQWPCEQSDGSWHHETPLRQEASQGHYQTPLRQDVMFHSLSIPLRVLLGKQPSPLN